MTPSHLATVRAACQRVLEMDKTASPSPWEPSEHCDYYLTEPRQKASIIKFQGLYYSNRRFVEMARNLSPALAQAVLAALDGLEKQTCLCRAVFDATVPCHRCQTLAAICAAFPKKIL